MTPQDLGRLAYQLVGVLALIAAVRLLPELISIAAMDFASPSGPSINVPLLVLAQALPIAILVSGGALLILKADALARMTAKNEECSRTVTAADAQSILFSAAGVLLVGMAVSSLPSILHNLAILASEFAQDLPSERRGVSTTTWAWLAGEIIQACIGVLLIVRGSSLVTLLRRRHDRATIDAVDYRCPHCGYWIDATGYRKDAAVYLCGNCKQELPRDRFASASG